MEIKTIKGISREKWRRFKEIAAKKDLSLGSMFEVMLEEFSRRGDGVWDIILSGEKIISDKEAEELTREIKRLRKERGFRI
jgi:hypothetical protein